MVFGYYGHPINQQRIVTEAYGAPVNVPAGSGFVIAQALNRGWQDDRGQRFQSFLRAAFDAQAGVATINTVVVVQALASGHPLIVGTQGHAMVVTAVSYVPTIDESRRSIKRADRDARQRARQSKDHPRIASPELLPNHDGCLA